jgi:hypothetical protein
MTVKQVSIAAFGAILLSAGTGNPAEAAFLGSPPSWISSLGSLSEPASQNSTLISNLKQTSILGGQLFSTGGDILVEVLPATAGLESHLHLYSPSYQRFIATNRQIGTTVNLGGFPVGVELIFGILAGGNTFLMGPGSRNPDGLTHAKVNFLSPGVALVGFEDLWGGGDRDYDDNVFRFTGGIAATQVPEPTTLLGSLLFGGMVCRWRMKRQKQ